MGQGGRVGTERLSVVSCGPFEQQEWGCEACNSRPDWGESSAAIS